MKSSKKHINKVSNYKILGSLGIGVMLALSGCQNNNSNTQEKNPTIKKGTFVIIEEQDDGSYKILDEYPSETTRVMLKGKDGSERLLSKEEIDTMLKEEENKIDNGTSQLTNPTGGGLSLGEAILASAAGAVLGSWIGSKLFNNQNYQTQQRTTYKSPQAYERSKNNMNNTRTTSATKATQGKSGFFGGGSSDRKQNVMGG